MRFFLYLYILNGETHLMHPIEASDSHTKNTTLEMDTVTAIIEESGSERPYHVSIAKDHLASLPAVPYNLTPILIDSQEQVEAAVKILREADIIGFDTETKPNFRKGGLNKVALLQLHTRTQGFLFRLNEIGLPDAVKDLLEDPDKLKIGLSIHDDFHSLAKIRPISPAGFVDLQPYVKQYKITDNSLARIYAIIFGKRISKSQQLSNWEAPTLTPAQMAYAALDALACIQIYDEINSGRFVPEESQFWCQVPPPPPPPTPPTPEELEAKRKVIKRKRAEKRRRMKERKRVIRAAENIATGLPPDAPRAQAPSTPASMKRTAKRKERRKRQKAQKKTTSE